MTSPSSPQHYRVSVYKGLHPQADEGLKEKANASIEDETKPWVRHQAPCYVIHKADPVPDVERLQAYHPRLRYSFPLDLPYFDARGALLTNHPGWLLLEHTVPSDHGCADGKAVVHLVPRTRRGWAN
ncbi:LOW QUALITY PROTEIN: hypothetical protein CVT26_007948 [Gymnopilus dilepis]|uniref:Uncharacterized protein n=1 Tax=Gymnopilus dilepis TaxID=231916 RepID=A0A409WER2_9AGAR|nr:LOW QUALITY PROTEIN: hypothetical protein CVT26_007948 [Gymnopilus dilepis]